MKAFILFLSLFFCSIVSAQTRVTTTTGNIYSGWIQYEDAQSVRLLTTDSLTVTITRDRIVRIDYGQQLTSIEHKPGDQIPGNGAGVVAAKEPNTDGGAYTGSFDYKPLPPGGAVSLSEEEVRPSFGIGASVGTPSLLMMIGAYHNNTLSARASAGFLQNVYGGQLSVGHVIKRGEDAQIYLGVAGGFSQIKNDTIVSTGLSLRSDEVTYRWLYIGPYVEITILGLFVEGGLSVGSGSFSNPQLMGQVGYVYFFDQD